MGETRNTHDCRDKSTQHFGRKTIGVITVDVSYPPSNPSIHSTYPQNCADPSSRAVRHGSVSARVLGLLVRIPPKHGCLSLVSVVLSGRGLSIGLITRTQESYPVWCV